MSQKSNKLSTEILTAPGVSTARLKSAVITLTVITLTAGGGNNNTGDIHKTSQRIERIRKPAINKIL